MSASSPHFLGARAYACTLIAISFCGWVASLFPPSDHEDSKHGLAITIVQGLEQCLHMVHNKCLLLQWNEATYEVLVVSTMPPSCHLAMVSFDI